MHPFADLCTMQIHLTPIAFVRNSRTTPIDDNWNEIISEIELAEHIPTEAILHLSDFSHLEIIFYFDKVDETSIVFSGHPRGNKNYPLTGIFAQRKKDRPNKLGLCTVELIDVKERHLKVKRLDAIDGTPVLDIKPVFKEFLPVGAIKQPAWTSDLMKAYW